MEVTKIEELFKDTLQNTRALYNKVNDYSEDQIYNWKKGRTTPTLGDMLSVLFQLKLIHVQETIVDEKFELPSILLDKDFKRTYTGNPLDDTDGYKMILNYEPNRQTPG